MHSYCHISNNKQKEQLQKEKRMVMEDPNHKVLYIYFLYKTGSY